jgi:aspartate/methionine/tyrosine aminotransferase
LLQVVTESIGAKVKHYRLVAERSWECDLEQMSALIDSRTRAIVINNPSNPCGSVYSEVRSLLICCYYTSVHFLVACYCCCYGSVSAVICIFVHKVHKVMLA